MTRKGEPRSQPGAEFEDGLEGANEKEEGSRIEYLRALGEGGFLFDKLPLSSRDISKAQALVAGSVEGTATGNQEEPVDGEEVAMEVCSTPLCLPCLCSVFPPPLLSTCRFAPQRMSWLS